MYKRLGCGGVGCSASETCNCSSENKNTFFCQSGSWNTVCAKILILTHIHTNCVCVRVRMHILVGARILSLPDGCPTVSSPVHAAFDLSAKSLQVLEQRNMRGGSTRATCAPFLVIFVGFREGSDLMVFILFGYLLIWQLEFWSFLAMPPYDSRNIFTLCSYIWNINEKPQILHCVAFAKSVKALRKLNCITKAKQGLCDQGTDALEKAVMLHINYSEIKVCIKLHCLAFCSSADLWFYFCVLFHLGEWITGPGLIF